MFVEIINKMVEIKTFIPFVLLATFGFKAHEEDGGQDEVPGDNYPYPLGFKSNWEAGRSY